MEHRTELESRESTENGRCSRDADFDRYVVPEIPALRRRARGLTGAFHDADDLVQETLMRAYRAIGTFDGRHPRAWLAIPLGTVLSRLHRARAALREDRRLSPLAQLGTVTAPDLVPAISRSGNPKGVTP